jgi:hypothetical protein
MNIDSSLSSLTPRRIWMQRLRFLIERQPTHGLTLAFNTTVSTSTVRHILDNLHAHIDRALYGRRFNKYSHEERTWFAAFIEHPDTNTHVHLIMRVAEDRHEAFQKLFPGERGSFWSHWAPRGTHALARIFDAEGWVVYATKQLPTDDDWIISDEFLPEYTLAK